MADKDNAKDNTADSATDIATEELEVPRDTWATIRRLWDAARSQHWRFYLVMVSIIFYTGFSLAAPAYSARVIDVLWNGISEAFAQGRDFTVTWDNAGRDIIIYLGIWTAACGFYSLQSFTMAGFAESQPGVAQPHRP